ncbi:MAG TPA: SAM-dependent methyltransferase [Pyrinomonadaceae bacterium]|nr:SAM-dependent methyltransferase [Pyrinomonadaceae bacterium]
MPTYRINPYISFIENRLFPGEIQRAVFHRLTGELIEYDFTKSLTADDVQLRQLIQRGFLITGDYDPLAPLLDWYVARPIQNPAVMYRSKTGEWMLVRTSMKQTVYSPKLDELPVVIEEQLTPLAADLLLMADGTKTLREIFSGLNDEREAIDFLTTQERQLIKLTPWREVLDDPFSNVNIVPRNLYHSDRKDQPAITDFHLYGIEEAAWEFDFIEPTVNHSFRFPHEALGGLDYGSRFCLSTLRPEVVPLLNESDHLEVLEVGGGTGSFARSFIKQAANKTRVNYHILDLSPALMANQRKLLSELFPESSHFHQDATEFDLPGKTFDLIVSNEVIADFPVASGRGEGAYYVEKYDLSNKDASDSFVVNAGVFRFIERAWKHLKPGGTLIVSEYGAEDRYPAASFNLNHDEYTIHFGHLAACAAKVGFDCRLVTLKEFLDLDDEVLVLNGREEHLLCLNHVLKNYGQALPYAVISKSDFEKQCGRVVEQTGLIGYSFSPLKTGYHYGPNIRDFFVLVMNKPKEN